MVNDSKTRRCYCIRRRALLPIVMQQPVKERIGRLREEIAQISDANPLHVQRSKKMPGAAGDQERLLQCCGKSPTS
jgi:hypothetical protein